MNQPHPPVQTPSRELLETKHTWIAEDTSLEGTLKFSGVTRIFGELKGKIIGLPGSHLIFMESSRVSGELSGEEITVNGKVEGKVNAARKLTVASMGRILGEVKAHDLQMEFGGVIEGEISINKK